MTKPLTPDPDEDLTIARREELDVRLICPADYIEAMDPDGLDKR